MSGSSIWPQLFNFPPRLAFMGRPPLVNSLSSPREIKQWSNHSRQSEYKREKAILATSKQRVKCRNCLKSHRQSWQSRSQNSGHFILHPGLFPPPHVVVTNFCPFVCLPVIFLGQHTLPDVLFFCSLSLLFACLQNTEADHSAESPMPSLLYESWPI